jgi:hypothetical protein
MPSLGVLGGFDVGLDDRRAITRMSVRASARTATEEVAEHIRD